MTPFAVQASRALQDPAPEASAELRSYLAAVRDGGRQTTCDVRGCTEPATAVVMFWETEPDPDDTGPHPLPGVVRCLCEDHEDTTRAR